MLCQREEIVLLKECTHVPKQVVRVKIDKYCGCRRIRVFDEDSQLSLLFDFMNRQFFVFVS